jgi:putative membrane protein
MIVVVIILLTLAYVCGWLRLRSRPGQALAAWRAASFLLGMFLAWGALDSPLVAYDHHLLTVHMIKHLLLMTVAPALILLGEPILCSSHGMPRLGRVVLHSWLRRPLARQFGRIFSRPAVCWTVSASALVAWHIPDVFTLAMQSDAWHAVEQSSFVAAGVLFWWPVIQPWPSVSNGPQWSILLYLFLATLPCDVLAGFLMFSERVAYPVYLSMPRHFGFSVLDDQQCAAALMWTSVTVIYLVPAAILSTQLLSPRDLELASHSAPIA